MNRWLFAAALVAMAVVRAPHVRRSVRVPVATNRETRVDRTLVVGVGIGMALGVVWLCGALGFADRPHSPAATGLGGALLAGGLVLLHCCHRDLGTNWSNTLVLRSGHALVTCGIYRRVRHPMYLALLLYGLGQALVVENLLAGPGFFVPFAALVALRLPAEERMLHERFGEAWTAYAAGSWRLVPWIW
ncbi:MAG: isoprenylcysteine carboxylmethyltransferase family protein [Planctomycetes bacterium]|nr:isoprenylcysteine carboxylmethyltransferase family protein [Planctomycetota bacterium]